MIVEEPLALKYRPKKLSQVIGQPVVVKAFTNAFKSNTLHHAYILGGNYGCGKCITENSFIFMENGIEKISNIVPDQTLSKFKKKLKCENGIGKTTGGYFETNAETIKIITNEGYFIEGTPEHPIRVMGENGEIIWRKFQEIQKNDYACIYRKEYFDKKGKEQKIFFNFNIKKYFSKKIGGDKYVICKICNKKYGNLSTHIQTHGISNDEYRGKFPNSALASGEKNQKNAIKSIKLDIHIPKKINIKLARLLGYLVSEGHINDDLISFSNNNKYLIKDFYNIAMDLFGFNPVTRKDKRNNVLNVFIYHLLARKFLINILGKGKSQNKTVPDIIFKSSNHIVKEFLKAYFEGDGFNNLTKGNYIGCSSISYDLLHQIQILLLRFGIISSVKVKHIHKLSYNDKSYISWNLFIYSYNMKIFKEKIGFISKRKNYEMNKICCHRKSNPNKDIIPYLQKILYRYWKNLPINRAGRIIINNKIAGVAPRWPSNCKESSPMHKNLTYNNLRDILIYLDKILEILNNFKDDKNIFLLFEKGKKLRGICKDIYSKRYFYSQVVSIIKSKANVYDICKEGNDKSFIANGFINHNTTVARIVAAMENCKKEGKDPCGKCSNCKDIFSGNSYEVIEMDAGSGGKVDAIRELSKSLRQCPVECKTKYVIIDECLGKNSRINTRDGLIPISRIVNDKIQIDVLSYNEKKHNTEYKPIVGWFKNSTKKIYKVIFETRGYLYASLGHLFFTPNGYKKLEELKVGDIIFREGQKINYYQEQLIYGSLLGDGNIRKSKSLFTTLKNGTSARLKFVHGKKQKKYLQFKEDILRNFIQTTLKKNIHIGWAGYGPIETYKFSTLTNRCFSEVYNVVTDNEIKRNKKIINEKWLLKIDWPGIAFWYMDDGSCISYIAKTMGKTRWQIRFSTHSFSLEEHQLLKSFLSSKGIKSNINKDKKKKAYILDLDVESSEFLLKNISKYIPECMRYKLYGYKGDPFDKTLIYKNIKNIKNTIVPEKIVEIIFDDYEKYTYDIEIKDNHNYFVSNTLVHNCHNLTGAAAEASLKMIEEPPPFVRFILCSTEPQSFKPTIHSRCIMWKFNKVPWPEMFEHLKKIAKAEKLDYEEGALQIAARYAKGSVRDSLQYLQTVINYVGDEKITVEAAREAIGAIDESLYFDFINGIINKNTMQCFQTINQIFRDGKEVKIILDGIYNHLNNLLITRVCKKDLNSFDFTQEEIKKYVHQNSKISAGGGDFLLQMMNLLNQVSFGIEYSLNPTQLFNKFAVESILIMKKNYSKK